MASKEEPAKLLLPYLQRADELQKHEPLVSYYCRLYAMERGLKIPQNQRTKTTNSLLVSLMNQLEKDKQSLKLGPDDNLHIEGFALNIFAKADKQDRAGRADKNTARTFYAASIFFEILYQFGELQPDLEQKQKYSAWKAADIGKALKEGRKPEPGPPGDADDLSAPSSLSVNSHDIQSGGSTAVISDHFPHAGDEVNDQPSVYIPPPAHIEDGVSKDMPHFPSSSYQRADFPSTASENFTYPSRSYSESSSHSYPNFHSYPSFAESSVPSVSSHYTSFHHGRDSTSHPAHAPLPTEYVMNTAYRAYSEPAPPTNHAYNQHNGSYQPPPDRIAEAHKAARFAVAALAFDDVSTGVEYLRKSLELLTNPSAGQ